MVKVNTFPKMMECPHGEMFTPDGEVNSEWWRWKFKHIETYQAECLESNLPPDAVIRVCKSMSDFLISQAKTFKIDLSTITNQARTELVVIQQPDDVLEYSESRLKDIINNLDEIVRGGIASVDQLEAEGIVLTETQKKRAVSRAKRMKDLFKKALAIQCYCRDRFPKKEDVKYLFGAAYMRETWNPWASREEFRVIFGWTRPLRIQQYAMRSDEMTPVPEVTKHMFHATVRLGVARYRGSAGILIAIPPRHGKTMWLFAVAVDDFADDAELNTSVLHARSDDAKERCERVRNMMTPNNPEGRRVVSLFPRLRVKGRRDAKNSSSRFSLHRISASTEPSMRAAGVNEAGEGRTLHRLYADDIVAAKERTERTTRDSTHKRWTGTWMKRLTGEHAFFIIICTFWHHDDTYARLIKSNRRIDGVPDMEVVRMPCGRGEDIFYPLWDPPYGRPYLTRQHRLDPTTYACTNLLDPQPDDLKIVKCLHYVTHDPLTCEADDKFVSESKGVLSIDPTATAGVKSDRAGVVYALVNPIHGKIRVIHAWEVALNQVELVEHLCEIESQLPVHEFIVETIGGHHATADMLEQIYPKDAVVRIPASGSAGKGARLRACAIHLEQGRVEFKGVHNPKENKTDKDPAVLPDPAYDWYFEQILKFGTVDQDHAVDATTQLANHYSQLLREAQEVFEEVTGEPNTCPPGANPRMWDAIQRNRKRAREMAMSGADGGGVDRQDPGGEEFALFGEWAHESEIA